MESEIKPKRVLEFGLITGKLLQATTDVVTVTLSYYILRN